jgi:methionyl-tRNA formyltransferase
VTASAVKERALAAGIPILQPARLRDAGWPERLAELHADVAVVVAFGQILPRAVLDAPARGSINVHASLLPRYRGAAPIAWAIMRGETQTGITTFQMDEGMDTGAMLLRQAIEIAAQETAGELAARLAAVGARVLTDTLDRLDALTPTPQRHGEATLAPRLKKSDGQLDWNRTARDLVNVVRGCNPWPGATIRTPLGSLTVWRADVAQRAEEKPGTLRKAPPARGETPGVLVEHERTLAIATGEDLLLPLEVQPENRRSIAWPDYLRGARLMPGVRFTSS